jgi:molecular chaperone GrpE
MEEKDPEAAEEEQETMPEEESPQEKYLRLAAEFDNYRKRSERDMAEYRKRASDGIILSVLEVLDNLDRALETTESCTLEDLTEGVGAIRGQLADLLSREGVEPIPVEGREFDPFEMEAMMRMPSKDVEEGHVLRELQKGYKGRGYVLRPSKVIVSSGPQKAEEFAEEGSTR